MKLEEKIKNKYLYSNKLNLLKIIYFFFQFLKSKFKPRLAYSHWGVDLIITKILKYKKKGVYIDVGCYHPIEISNTALLYNKGWNGINIDISAYSIRLFNFLKPDDINLNLAVSNLNDKVDIFYQKKLSKISTINKKLSQKIFQGKIITKKITCKKLTKIIDESIYKNREIHFLNIDAESHDLQVLKSLDFNRYSPKIICIEIFPEGGDFKNFKIHESKVYKFLLKRNYKLNWSGFFSHIFKLNTYRLNK